MKTGRLFYVCSLVVSKVFLRSNSMWGVILLIDKVLLMGSAKAAFYA